MSFFNESIGLTEYFRPNDAYISEIKKACDLYHDTFRNGGQGDIKGVEDIINKFALYLNQELKGKRIVYAGIEGKLTDVQISTQLYDFARVKPVITFVFENIGQMTLEYLDLRFVQILD